MIHPIHHPHHIQQWILLVNSFYWFSLAASISDQILSELLQDDPFHKSHPGSFPRMKQHAMYSSFLLSLIGYDIFQLQSGLLRYVLVLDPLSCKIVAQLQHLCLMEAKWNHLLDYVQQNCMKFLNTSCRSMPSFTLLQAFLRVHWLSVVGWVTWTCGYSTQYSFKLSIVLCFRSLKKRGNISRSTF